MWMPWLDLMNIVSAYKIGDIVPMSRKGQYHAMHIDWHDVIGHHCLIFGVYREVLLPIPKPVSYTGADVYKILFQVGREISSISWILVINCKSPEVPMIDVHLRYSGADIHEVTAKVMNMPHHYVETHKGICKEFWDLEHWPKRLLARYFWEESSEIDVSGGFYVPLGSGFLLTLVMSIYISQSSQEKLARFVRENIAGSSLPGEAAKVE